ncbi:hypothetical protein NDU88_001235 [Pleurodeles waltl]|uniref:Uncharacterized protein n=1 Tax=Pleurodeles waltl TaxID=8319 RepID=A0AAV7MKY3_PLEWA|nr:hypothetical protein NDU88_001235 [Pleurodeles waltl]
MAEKRSQTEELLKALMLRMDAMDQAIASLKAQTSSLGVGASSNEDVPQREGILSSEAIPPAPKRVRGRGRKKMRIALFLKKYDSERHVPKTPVYAVRGCSLLERKEPMEQQAEQVW